MKSIRCCSISMTTYILVSSSGKTQISMVLCSSWSLRKDSSKHGLPPTQPPTDTDTSEERVRKGAEKLQKFLNAKQQGRLDGFFSVKTKTSPKKSKVDDAKSKSKTVKDGKGTKRKVSICSKHDDLY